MSVTSSTLAIQPGELIIGGRILWVDGATQIDISNPIADGYGQIVLTIDLSKTSSTETFEQVELSVVYSATDAFPALTKGKINSQNGDMVYQAEMAVVSIAGGNVTGIVSQIADVLGGTWYQDKITALESGLADTEEKAAALSNPNLLINGGVAVWQRGESFTIPRTGYGAGQYTADRWRVWANADSTGGNITVTRADDGMHIEADGAGLATYRFEEAEVKKLSGKTVTLSQSVDGVVSSAVRSFPTTGILNVALPVSGTINWIKLELGEEATPFVPRSYGEELLACMRYYQNTGTVFCPGYITVGGVSFTYMPPVPMRSVPTIGGNVNDMTVRPVDSDVIYQQTLGISSSQSSGDTLYLTTTAPGVTANRPCVVQFWGLTLNAEMG
nr:MAG TPA: tail fiber protein [Caudoviricetes sp.]